MSSEILHTYVSNIKGRTETNNNCVQPLFLVHKGRVHGVFLLRLLPYSILMLLALIHYFVYTVDRNDYLLISFVMVVVMD